MPPIESQFEIDEESEHVIRDRLAGYDLLTIADSRYLLAALDAARAEAETAKAEVETLRILKPWHTSAERGARVEALEVALAAAHEALRRWHSLPPEPHATEGEVSDGEVWQAQAEYRQQRDALNADTAVILATDRPAPGMDDEKAS